MAIWADNMLLLDSRTLLSLFKPLELSASDQSYLLKNAHTYAAKWGTVGTHQQTAWFNRLLEKVVVARAQVTVTVKKSALLEQLMDPECIASLPCKEAIHVLQLPAQLKRCGIETILVIPNGPPPSAHSRAINAFQDALRKALVWNQNLLEGKGPTLADIANREGVNARYLGQLIRLAYLAPDIMDRIFAGDLPVALPLENIKGKGIPLDWQVQCQHYGFAG